MTLLLAGNGNDIIFFSEEQMNRNIADLRNTVTGGVSSKEALPNNQVSDGNLQSNVNIIRTGMRFTEKQAQNRKLKPEPEHLSYSPSAYKSTIMSTEDRLVAKPIAALVNFILARG